ncbi:hypothetical protein WDU94_009453 [Cyamophila willieti]
MQEHPNYKYRPRRRKHNKRSGSVGASPPSSVHSSHSPNVPVNRRPDQSQQVKQVSQTNYPNSPYDNSGGTYSPGLHQQYPYYSPTKSSPFYANSDSPYTPAGIHTPESSPACSPEPTENKMLNPSEDNNNSSLNVESDSIHPGLSIENASSKINSSSGHAEQETSTTTLPTPEMSPMEQEKDNFLCHQHQQSQSSCSNEEKQNFYMRNQQPSISSYYHRIPQHLSPSYRSPVYNPTYQQGQSAAIAAMGVAKGGMVMMCTNQRLLGTYEHSGIVTGTFYPPIATSQDQQALSSGTSGHHLYSSPLSNSRAFLSGYASSANPSQYVSCPSPGSFIRNDLADQSKNARLSYQQHQASSYEQVLEEHNNNHSDILGNNEVNNHDCNENTSHPSVSVHQDFEKYLKYSTIPSIHSAPLDVEHHVLDTNHNYQHQLQQYSNTSYHPHHSNFQESNLLEQQYLFSKNSSNDLVHSQQISSPYLVGGGINPETNYPVVIENNPSNMNSHSQIVPNLGPPQIPGNNNNNLKAGEEDFSVILADVRKTCYSS